MKILIIEDEVELLEDICGYLGEENYICETASNFSSAEEKLELYHYDIAVVDITLPGGSGLQLIELLKSKHTDTGVLIISAKNSLDDKINGLNIGADDYLTKPFHLAELNARIKALIRRRRFDGATKIIFNEIEIDADENLILINHKPLVLTRKEYELLNFFIANKNRILTKESIAEHLWGDDIDLADNFFFVYTHINNLRKKIIKKGGNDYIKTVYGMGYKFSDKQ